MPRAAPGAVGDAVDISVVISTFNGADGLPGVLEALLAQDSHGVCFEVIVVDNNSNDHTPHVIDSFVARGHGRIRHLVERRQGVSFGRNTGIQSARGRVIAFTDDDVIPSRDWIANIYRAFAESGQIDYVTGRMLPLYQTPPPAWMTPLNSGPCVLRDRGAAAFFSKAGCFFPGWATANLAFRRDVFDRIGLFSGDFPRGQDLEFIVRLWRARGRGMYAPDVVVVHKVPSDRLTKAYHRMWHTREGEIRGRIRFREIFDTADRVMLVPPRRRTLLGLPVFLVRELVTDGLAWVSAVLRRNDAGAFYYECQTRQTLSYIRTRCSWRTGFAAYSSAFVRSDGGHAIPALSVRKTGRASNARLLSGQHPIAVRIRSARATQLPTSTAGSFLFRCARTALTRAPSLPRVERRLPRAKS